MLLPQAIPDVLCVFGRGIEKAGGRWRPTSYVEKLDEQLAREFSLVKAISQGLPYRIQSDIAVFGNDPAENEKLFNDILKCLARLEKIKRPPGWAEEVENLLIAERIEDGLVAVN